MPEHFTPHSLRHTFASLLLQQGEAAAGFRVSRGGAGLVIQLDRAGARVVLPEPGP